MKCDLVGVPNSAWRDFGRLEQGAGPLGLWAVSQSRTLERLERPLCVRALEVELSLGGGGRGQAEVGVGEVGVVRLAGGTRELERLR